MKLQEDGQCLRIPEPYYSSIGVFGRDGDISISVAEILFQSVGHHGDIVRVGQAFAVE